MTHPASSAHEMAERDRRWQFLTSYAIKWIAIITMVLDHVAAIIIWQIYGDVWRSGARADAAAWYDLYLLMRHIGRIAFPLFCFLLAEGFAHTRSKPKYAWRLFLFALIAEWPYDFALYGTGFELVEHQNVMFTLLVSFLALWGGEALGGLIDRALARRRGGAGLAGHTRLGAHGAPGASAGTGLSAAASAHGTLGAISAGGDGLAGTAGSPAALGAHAATTAIPVRSAERGLTLPVILCTVALVLVGAVFADVTEMSYHAFGVLLCGALYLGRRFRLLQIALGALLVAWYCWDHADLFESYAVIGLALLLFYNGKRGRAMKWFFYVFYPAHLLIIAAIAALMG